MADNLIRWKKGDYVRLGRAINKFNKEVKALEKEGYNYLPEVKSYQSIKENIYTRKELNRLINSMKKFTIETAKEIETPSGLKLTSWEFKELKLARNRARKFLEGKLEQQELANPYAKYGLETKEIEQTKKTISSLGRLETATPGFDLNRIMDRIKRLGSYDITMKKADQYRKNYMEALEHMSNYENYDLLKEKLESIKNPEQFYEFVSENTTLSDLFEYYNDSPEAQTYGGFDNNQAAFNKALRELGILEDIELIDLSDQVVHLE